MKNHTDLQVTAFFSIWSVWIQQFLFLASMKSNINEWASVLRDILRTIASVSFKHSSTQYKHTIMKDFTQSISQRNTMIENKRERSMTLPLSYESLRKVSFAENEAVTSQCNDDSLASYRITGTESFNGERRIVSNETIDTLPDMKNKSRSLPSLSRSGDLKSLFIESTLQENSNQIRFPSVSEDCLLSTCIDDDDIIHTSICESHTDPLEPIKNTQPTCSGWGQFVDFVPLDQSPRRKQINPRSRRRNSSTGRFHRRHVDSCAKKYSTLQRRNRKSQSTSMYNRKKDNNTSTNDMVKAFNVQLSL